MTIKKYFSYFIMIYLLAILLVAGISMLLDIPEGTIAVIILSLQVPRLRPDLYRTNDVYPALQKKGG